MFPPDVQFLCSGPADLVKNYTADKFSYTPDARPPKPEPDTKKAPPERGLDVSCGLQKLRAGFEGLLQGIRMDHVLPDHAVAAPALAGAAETHAHLVQQAAFQLRQLQAQTVAQVLQLPAKTGERLGGRVLRVVEMGQFFPLLANAPAGVFDGRTGFFKDGAGLDLLLFGQALEPLVDIAVAARPVTAAVMPPGSRHERQQQERCHDQTTDNYILPHRQTLFCWAMLLAYQACVRGARKGRRQAVAFFLSFLVLAKNMQAKYPTAR